MKQAPVLTERDMKRLLQHVSRNTFPVRNRCLLMFRWLASMRVAEVAVLKISDVMTVTGEVRPEIQLTAAQTKGNSARTVLVNSQLKSEIKSYSKSQTVIRSVIEAVKFGEVDIQIEGVAEKETAELRLKQKPAVVKRAC